MKLTKEKLVELLQIIQSRINEEIHYEVFFPENLEELGLNGKLKEAEDILYDFDEKLNDWIKENNEITYYTDGLTYLQANDPSLIESFYYLNDFGMLNSENLENLNSATLANVHLTSVVHEIIYEEVSKFLEKFENSEDLEE